MSKKRKKSLERLSFLNDSKLEGKGSHLLQSPVSAKRYKCCLKMSEINEWKVYPTGSGQYIYTKTTTLIYNQIVTVLNGAVCKCDRYLFYNKNPKCLRIGTPAEDCNENWKTKTKNFVTFFNDEANDDWSCKMNMFESLLWEACTILNWDWWYFQSR